MPGADFVIGSRYIPGGSIPENWGRLRQAISRWGNIFARYLAGLYRVQDCTAGFRAIRGSLLQRIDFSSLKVQGYAFQIALLNQAMLNQAVIREIPVDFIDRERGATKLGLADVIEFVINVWWIRFQASRTFLKFAAVGIFGVVINLATFIVLVHLGVNKFLASPLAIELAIVNNFLLNNYWTFRARNSSEPSPAQGVEIQRRLPPGARRQLCNLFGLRRPVSPHRPLYSPGRRHSPGHGRELLSQCLLDL